MWENTTKGNGSTDKGVKFLVATDSELQVTGSDALDFEILCCISGKFEDFGREVFENCGEVDGRFGADSGLLARDVAEVTLYATAWKLRVSLLAS